MILDCYRVSQTSPRTQRNRRRVVSLIASQVSEGREFLIAIVGCFSTQEPGSLRVSIREGPVKGNVDCFDKGRHRYLVFVMLC
jgi:hypothetical protein